VAHDVRCAAWRRQRRALSFLAASRAQTAADHSLTEQHVSTWSADNTAVVSMGVHVHVATLVGMHAWGLCGVQLLGSLVARRSCCDSWKVLRNLCLCWSFIMCCPCKAYA
jgi:hypothetical protein